MQCLGILGQEGNILNLADIHVLECKWDKKIRQPSEYDVLYIFFNIWYIHVCLTVKINIITSKFLHTVSDTL